MYVNRERLLLEVALKNASINAELEEMLECMPRHYRNEKIYTCC